MEDVVTNTDVKIDFMKNTSTKICWIFAIYAAYKLGRRYIEYLENQEKDEMSDEN